MIVAKAKNMAQMMGVPDSASSKTTAGLPPRLRQK